MIIIRQHYLFFQGGLLTTLQHCSKVSALLMFLLSSLSVDLSGRRKVLFHSIPFSGGIWFQRRLDTKKTFQVFPSLDSISILQSDLTRSCLDRWHPRHHTDHRHHHQEDHYHHEEDRVLIPKVDITKPLQPEVPDQPHLP